MTSQTWRKSSYSTEGTSAQCVEVADLRDFIGVRDSKAADTGHLCLSAAQFSALVRRIKDAK